jgi:AraC family transcriptional regulator
MLRTLDGGAPLPTWKPVRTAEYAVELHRSGPSRLPPLYHNFHRVAVALDGPRPVRAGAGAATTTVMLARGESAVRAAGMGVEMAWPHGANFLLIHLHPRLIRSLGQATLGDSTVGLASRSRLDDPTIESIGFELVSAVFREAPLDLDAARELVMSLGEHLVRRYSTIPAPGALLGAHRLEEVLDRLREAPEAKETVLAVSRRSRLSRSHFSRQVRRFTGASPGRMVHASRVEAAKHLLFDPAIPLARVAAGAGFADQSHLTRALRRATGIGPGQYRRLSVALRARAAMSTSVQDPHDSGE